MCTQVVRLFMALALFGCSMFALPAKALAAPSSQHAMAQGLWDAAGDPTAADAASDDPSSPATGETQADPSGPLSAGQAVLEPALLMARPLVQADAAWRTHHPDGLQRPPCRAVTTA